MPMLQVKELIKIYKTKEGAETCALDNVNISFEASGMNFILGKSGCGKTTLLNLLGGLDAPTDGEIIFDGRSSADFKQADYDGWRNECVGFVFQDLNLVTDLNVGQNVGLALELQGKKADRETVDAYLREVELVDRYGETLYNRRINELSGGQKQRVTIARALIKNPKLILADEPTGALDSKTGKQIYELLKRLSSDRLIIIVTHDEESARTFGDWIIEMSDGQVISDSKAKTIAASGEAKRHRSGGRLSVKRVLLLGLKGLKHKTGRLVVTMLLSVVCFFALGFCLTFYTVNNDAVQLNTMKDRGLSLFLLKSGYKPDVWNTAPIAFSDEQLKIIDDYGEYLNVGRIDVSYSGENDGEDSNGYRNTRDYYYKYGNGINPDEYQTMLLQEIDTAVFVNESIDISKYGYVPDSRFVDPSLCRLPQNENEIALTDFHFTAFKEFGYRKKTGDSADVKIEIKTPDDLIGLRLGNYTICGVYSSEADLEYMQAHRAEYNGVDRYTYLSQLGASIGWYSVADYAIVYKDDADMIASRIKNEVLMKLDGNASEIQRLIKQLSGKTYIDELEEERPRRAYISSPIVAFMLDESLLLAICGVSLLAIGPLAVFGILLFMTFLSVSIERRKRELGIMRAIGASTRDVVGVCLAESFIIAAIDFVISAIVLGFVCLGLNLAMHVTMFIPGVLPMLGMFGLSFLTAALATIIPVVRLAKKKPVEILRTVE